MAGNIGTVDPYHLALRVDVEMETRTCKSFLGQEVGGRGQKIQIRNQEEEQKKVNSGLDSKNELI